MIVGVVGTVPRSALSYPFAALCVCVVNRLPCFLIHRIYIIFVIIDETNNYWRVLYPWSGWVILSGYFSSSNFLFTI